MEKTVTSYTLKGHLVAETPITVSYVGMNQAIPRTPHGQAYLNGGTLRSPLRKAALSLVLPDVAMSQDQPMTGIDDGEASLLTTPKSPASAGIHDASISKRSAAPPGGDTQ